MILIMGGMLAMDVDLGRLWPLIFDSLALFVVFELRLGVKGGLRALLALLAIVFRF